MAHKQANKKKIEETISIFKIQYIFKENRKDSTGVKVLALHNAYLGLIPNSIYGPLAQPECPQSSASYDQKKNQNFERIKREKGGRKGGKKRGRAGTRGERPKRGTRRGARKGARRGAGGEGREYIRIPEDTSE